MILVDTSIWVNHLRSGDKRLTELLQQNKVLVHPFVTGELACGNLHNRDEILRLLNDLPQSPLASPSEALYFIDKHQLMGLGVGYVDIHLLAATALAEQTAIWTADVRLNKIAREMELAFDKNKS